MFFSLQMTTCPQEGQVSWSPAAMALASDSISAKATEPVKTARQWPHLIFTSEILVIMWAASRTIRQGLGWPTLQRFEIVAFLEGRQ